MEGAPSVMARLGQVDVTLADANVVRAVLHRDDDPWAVLVLPDGTAVAGTPDLKPPPAKVDPAAALQVRQQGLTDVLARTCLSPDTRGQVEVVRDIFADRKFVEDPSMVGELLPFIDDVRGLVAAEFGPDPTLDAAVGGLRDLFPRPGPSDAELDGRLAAISAFVEELVGGALGPVPPGEVDGLAARAVGLVRKRSPGNARWGIASGCGAAMDDGTGHFVSEPVECGMGHVTPRAARFLARVVR